MSISRIEIKDFLVFKGDFAIDFCPCVNVLIGSNGTGKTILMKVMYHAEKQSNAIYFNSELNLSDDTETYTSLNIRISEIDTGPEMPLKRNFYKRICNVIGGEVETTEEGFFIKRPDGLTPFPMESSGYRKLGLLATLIHIYQVKSGYILFWDEPENGISPEVIPVLVNILLELSRSGVQIFLTTHSDLLAEYFQVNRRKKDNVIFHSLYKDGKQIKADSNERFDLLNPNELREERMRLYTKYVRKVMG